MLKVEINKTEKDEKELTFPILVVNGAGYVFFVTKNTNGDRSPRIMKDDGEITYTSQFFDLSKPFPQNGYDLFKGSITLTQE